LEDPYIIDTSGWNDGTYEIMIKANDNLGNEAIFWFEITVDAIAPTIVSTSPADNAENLDLDTTIVLTFNEPINQTNIESLITLSPFLEFTIQWDLSATELSIIFETDGLSEGISYDLIVGNELSDLAGNHMKSEFSMTFTTKLPLDSDNDGIPDFEDPDDDNDGLEDSKEDVNANGIVDAGETDPLDPDTDSDGYNDFKDKYPLDSSKWKLSEEPTDSILILILILLVTVVIVLLLVFLVLKKDLFRKTPTFDEEEVEWVEVSEESFQCPECGKEFNEIVPECPDCGAEFEDFDEEEVTLEEISEDTEILPEETEFEILTPPPPLE
jgi:hypothetical protein